MSKVQPKELGAINNYGQSRMSRSSLPSTKQIVLVPKRMLLVDVREIGKRAETDIESSFLAIVQIWLASKGRPLDWTRWDRKR